MSDPYERARLDMVATQIERRGVRDERVLAAMRRVPRHRFVPDTPADMAYEDHPAPIGCKQTISQPYVVALMTELLAVLPTDRVLEVGTGSGYQTAILAELAAEVISIERHGALSQSAGERLRGLGYTNVTAIEGDGSLGYPEGAPYDGVLVTAACPETPAPLVEQLAVGGRLVCPVGPRDVQRMVVITRTTEGELRNESIRCIFVPLIGEAGWPET